MVDIKILTLKVNTGLHRYDNGESLQNAKTIISNRSILKTDYATTKAFNRINNIDIKQI